MTTDPTASAHPRTASPLGGLARFLRRVGRLKTTPRTGWLDRGVPAAAAESVADHTFRTALLAWLAALSAQAPAAGPGAGPGAGPAPNPDRVLRLALIHDLAEALTGDPPPYDPAALPPDAAARRAFLDGRHVRAPKRAATKRAAEDAAMADLLADLPPPLAADPARPMASFAAEVADVITDPTLAALRDAIGISAGDPTNPPDPTAYGGSRSG